jgi:sodium-dependent dicarboxylate transporter 2/3/5
MQPGRGRAIAGAVLAPAAFAGLWVAPLPVNAAAHHLVAIFAAVLVAWVTEVIPVAATAVLIGPLLVVCGVTSPTEAFRHYADPLLFLFVGAFMLAASMQRHGLDRRFARAVVTLPIVRGVPWRMHAAIVVAATLMSMWISNTATCAIFIPILLGMPGLARPAEGAAPLGEDRGRDPATGPLLALGYVCSTAGLGTLVGTPPNLITVRFLEDAGVQIGFLEWLAIGVPAAVLLSFVAALITMRRSGPLPMGTLAASDAPGPWTRGEIVTAASFALAVLGWTVPPICEAVGAPFARELSALLHPGVVAVLACLPLFAIPDRLRVPGDGAPAAVLVPILPWSAAVRIDWGVILLFGGGIALGTQLEETGLASGMSHAVVAWTGPTDVWTLSVIACATTVVLSEVASNTAAANILVPIVIALAAELHVSPIPPALAVGVGASIGFMLPIATGPNALVFSTGRVPQPAMMRAGFLLDVACLLIVLALLRIICPLMGWM